MTSRNDSRKEHSHSWELHCRRNIRDVCDGHRVYAVNFTVYGNLEVVATCEEEAEDILFQSLYRQVLGDESLARIETKVVEDTTESVRHRDQAIGDDDQETAQVKEC